MNDPFAGDERLICSDTVGILPLAGIIPGNAHAEAKRGRELPQHFLVMERDDDVVKSTALEPGLVELMAGLEGRRV